MMLRASSQATQREFQFGAVVDGNSAEPSGVPNAELLIAFTEAVVARDQASIRPLRERIRSEMSEGALVDVCGVVANFHRMTRVADATGIPLDQYAIDGSEDLRETLGINAYPSAQNTFG